ncbi:MAG: hypothetical protein K2M06_01285 [Muribaculaceae bacterium]|nr:hypothetical protein [Muribaculaceae bacterium]
MKEFNENEAVAAMRGALDVAAAAKYSDDDLLEVLDLIFDHYEENGDLEPDGDDSDVDDEEEIKAAAAYVTRYVKKDKNSKIDLADVEALVRGEYEYELSLI